MRKTREGKMKRKRSGLEKQKIQKEKMDEETSNTALQDNCPTTAREIQTGEGREGEGGLFVACLLA